MTATPIPAHLQKYPWYASHQAWLREQGLPHHDPGDAPAVRADLRGAYLSSAYLDGAYLSGASLACAYLDGAYLSGASLDGVTGLPDLRRPGLAAAVLQQITEHPDTWDQSQWHCDTRHCAAGWACVLAEVPREAEHRLGTAHAARLALGLQLSEPAPFGPTDNPLPWLQELATKEEAQK